MTATTTTTAPQKSWPTHRARWLNKDTNTSAHASHERARERERGRARATRRQCSQQVIGLRHPAAVGAQLIRVPPWPTRRCNSNNNGVGRGKCARWWWPWPHAGPTLLCWCIRGYSRSLAKPDRLTDDRRRDASRCGWGVRECANNLQIAASRLLPTWCTGFLLVRYLGVFPTGKDLVEVEEVVVVCRFLCVLAKKRRRNWFSMGYSLDGGRRCERRRRSAKRGELLTDELNCTNPCSKKVHLTQFWVLFW